MRQSLLILIFLLQAPHVVCGGGDTGTPSKAAAPMKIYYHEFGTAPYAPTTMENVEERPDYIIWVYSNHPLKKKLLEVFEAVPTTRDIDRDTIRLKVKFYSESKQVYYVDRHGVVFKEGGQRFILKKSDLMSLHNDIVYLHGIVDQRPQLDPWPDVWEKMKLPEAY